MKLTSYIRDGLGLRPVEIEISLTPGIPKIQFLGLPDPLIRESVVRIQSALKHQGYRLPKSKQILVNLRPNYLKKSSRGLDLAVAAGILWETNQEVAPEVESVALYGELSLKGDVLVPDDFTDIIELPRSRTFYTGRLTECDFEVMSLGELKDLKSPNFIRPVDLGIRANRPELPNIKVTLEQAELIKIAAHGEHHTLFAGPPGTGKTTLAFVIANLLGEPNSNEFKKSQQISRHFGIPTNWRPVVAPHHTSTNLAMIGGGGQPKPGEITRAHGGVLVMDEFLEFEPKVIEALREPLEAGKITISRTGSVMVFPARFILLATTNLCPCGHLIPAAEFDCKGRPKFCLNSIQKMSGPMLDRFSILAFSHPWASSKTVPVGSILKDLESVRDFSQFHYPDNVNQHLPVDEIEKTLDTFAKKFLVANEASHRRYNALIRVARTVADIDLSEIIKAEHLEKARVYTSENFQALSYLRGGRFS